MAAMQTSQENSTKPLPSEGFMSEKSRRRLVYALLAVAPLGFIDSAYLTIEHFLGSVPPCSVVRGCETVTTSSYSVIFGIPMALMGALYYLAIILGLVYYLDAKKSWMLKSVSISTAAGFFFSLYLVYLQLFVLKAICIYCMFSALTSTALFIFGLLVLKSLRSLERRAASS
jgi:uncharacterized membrane protein